MGMTREEAKEVFLNRGFIDGIYDSNKWREACIVISKWLEQEPTTKNDLAVSSELEKNSQKLEKNSQKLEKNFGELDCISRVEVIDYLCKHCPDDGECKKDCDEIKHLRQMPSVTPQEPILDKIRAEIAKIPKKYPMTMDYENGLKEAIGIIDKYKAESEE